MRKIPLEFFANFANEFEAVLSARVVDDALRGEVLAELLEVGHGDVGHGGGGGGA